MIPIDVDSERIGEIVLRTQATDALGDPTTITETTIVAGHVVALQDATVSDRIDSGKLGIEVSHKIYPKDDPGDTVEILNHYYKIDGNFYRITWIHDFGPVKYYSAVHDNFGRATP